MNREKEINLGKYLEMPTTFEKLRKAEEILEKEGHSLEELDLNLEFGRIAYDVTPYDVITFASTGMDGIHFGLLTDFGTVTDLENAFVVCISPMDFGEHIKIVARNIREFVGLLCTMKSAVEISDFNYTQEIKQNDHEEHIDNVIEKLMAIIKCELIDDEYDYIEKKVKIEREQQIILSTQDGIGVVPIENKNLNHTIYKLEKDNKVNLNEVRKFFNTSTIESKLAFIRDVQFTFLIDEEELMGFVIDEMIKLGLTDEVNRLKNLY